LANKYSFNRGSYCGFVARFELQSGHTMVVTPGVIEIFCKFDNTLLTKYIQYLDDDRKKIWRLDMQVERKYYRDFKYPPVTIGQMLPYLDSMVYAMYGEVTRRLSRYLKLLGRGNIKYGDVKEYQPVDDVLINVFTYLRKIRDNNITIEYPVLLENVRLIALNLGTLTIPIVTTVYCTREKLCIDNFVPSNVIDVGRDQLEDSVVLRVITFLKHGTSDLCKIQLDNKYCKSPEGNYRERRLDLNFTHEDRQYVISSSVCLETHDVGQITLRDITPTHGSNASSVPLYVHSFDLETHWIRTKFNGESSKF
jgi:hypothetical protein